MKNRTQYKQVCANCKKNFGVFYDTEREINRCCKCGGTHKIQFLNGEEGERILVEDDDGLKGTFTIIEIDHLSAFCENEVTCARIYAHHIQAWFPPLTPEQAYLLDLGG